MPADDRSRIMVAWVREGEQPYADPGIPDNPGTNTSADSGTNASAESHANCDTDLIANYPIVSIEDPLSEDDWDGWISMTLTNVSVMLLQPLLLSRQLSCARSSSK